MRRKPKAAPVRLNISRVFEGKKYSGTYTVSGRGPMTTVTVRTHDGSKSTHAGSSAEAVAGDLLRELAIEGKAGPGTAVKPEAADGSEDGTLPSGDGTNAASTE